ncbi:hypothetical protein LTS15_009881 [Exophiala xenobiotica]|nr:hypothetical protein LTS15_009881 [Exophiala xenobiotica]
MSPPPPAGAVRLLCLDGGGVKGISSLMILDAIMKRVRQIEGEPEDVREHFPFKYFDLAGGTSTGGLAAVMLFRLKLSTPNTMEHYDNMSKRIFSPSLGPLNLHPFGRPGYWLGNGVLKLKALLLPARFSAKPLERAINVVAGIDTKLKGDPDSPKMLMCSTLADKGETILFRSYDPPRDAEPVTSGVNVGDFADVTILEAARATSAAPTYLPEMIIKGHRFWDGGLLNNNPIDQVWDARYDLARTTTQTPVVSCVVSIGTGWSESKPSSSVFFKRFLNTISQAVSFATNTEAKHRDFERNIRRMNERLPPSEQTKYFRFNAPTGTEIFNLDDWQRMYRLKELTLKYLEQSDTRAKINDCAQALARKRAAIQGTNGASNGVVGSP